MVYNRYIRNDHGVYTRIQTEPARSVDPSERRPPPAPPFSPPPVPPPPVPPPPVPPPPPDPPLPPPGAEAAGLARLLRRLHVQNLDSSDLLLLLLVFLLARERADEELLFALGLLLIL